MDRHGIWRIGGWRGQGWTPGHLEAQLRAAKLLGESLVRLDENGELELVEEATTLAEVTKELVRVLPKLRASFDTQKTQLEEFKNLAAHHMARADAAEQELTDRGLSPHRRIEQQLDAMKELVAARDEEKQQLQATVKTLERRLANERGARQAAQDTMADYRKQYGKVLEELDALQSSLRETRRRKREEVEEAAAKRTRLVEEEKQRAEEEARAEAALAARLKAQVEFLSPKVRVGGYDDEGPGRLVGPRACVCSRFTPSAQHLQPRHRTGARGYDTIHGQPGSS